VLNERLLTVRIHDVILLKSASVKALMLKYGHVKRLTVPAASEQVGWFAMR